MPMNYDLNLRDFWRTIRKRKGIVIFTIVMMTLFSFIFSILGRPDPIYKTNATVKVEKTGSLAGLYAQSISWASTSYMETQLAVIKSYFLMELVAKKMGAIPPELSSDEVRQNPVYLSAILEIKGKVETEQEGNSDIINITVSSEDPQQAQRFANAVAEVYKEWHTMDLNKRIIEANKFIESQLTVAKDKLQKSEEAVRDFREANRMVSLDSHSSSLVSQFLGIQTKHNRDLDIINKINQVDKLLTQAESSPLPSKTIFTFEEASTSYKSLNDRLVQLMLERDVLLIHFTEHYSQVIEIKKQIQEITGSMRAQLRTQQQSLSQTVKRAEKQLKELDDQLKALPAKGLELARLERDVNVNREIYTLLAKQHQESLIRSAEKAEEVQIVKPALLPSKPINPPKTAASTSLGLIIGIILAVVFAFVVETFDTSIGAVEEVEEFVGARVLGVIPYVNADELKLTLQDKIAKDADGDQLWRIGRLISHFAPKTTSAESYRAIRTNINFVRLEKDVKTIVFTSSSSEEGKTTVAINLAIAMAQAGNRVLLVDGDLRRPAIAKIFGIPSAPGLTDVILGNYKWRDVVRSVTDIMMGKMTMDEIMITPGLDNVHIMTCGTVAPNPSELVSSQLNTDVIKESHEEYDFVIIDAPPVLAATDAAVWGTKADGVVLVYQVGKVARGALKRAKTQLANVNARIIGVVLNGLKAEISPDYEYHGKYHYYYGSERTDSAALGARITSWQALSKNYVTDVLEKLGRFAKKKETRTRHVSNPSGLRPGPTRIGLLVLAVGLLISGAYYAMVIGRPDPALVKSGVLITTPPPSKDQPAAAAVMAPGSAKEPDSAEAPPPSQDQPAAAPVMPPKTAKEPSDTESLPSRDASMPSLEKVALPPAPKEPEQPFAIQVQAMKSLSKAKDTVTALKMQGYDAHQEMVDLKRKGIWYRILIGKFASADDARQYMKSNHIEDVYPQSRIRRTSNREVAASESKGTPSKEKSVPPKKKSVSR
ncbi:MAG: AAA family ATPase [Thermodesulfobacteriota bacterium]